MPRLINVIADATLVFGYGEERSEIDAALIDEVIADLDATGVLGPALEREPPRVGRPGGSGARPRHGRAGRSAGRRAPAPAPARAAEDEKLARELAELRARAEAARSTTWRAASASSPSSAASSPSSTAC